MGDALACIEFQSISRGLRTLDAIAKRAPVNLRHHGRHSGPKYVILFDGAVAAVEESLNEALESSRGGVFAHTFLPVVHEKLWGVFDGAVSDPTQDLALLFVELSAVSAAVESLDYALKLIDAEVVDAQFASGISGIAYFALQGELHDIEYCESELRNRLPEADVLGIEVVARPHDDLLAALGHSPVFAHHW